MIAAITRDYPDWMGEGPHRWPIMQVRYGSSGSDPSSSTGCTRTTAATYGKSHVITGTTPVVLGRWYHLAVQHGFWGLRSVRERRP